MKIENQTAVIIKVTQFFFVALFDAKGLKIPSRDIEWANELLNYLIFEIIDFIDENDNEDMIFVKCMSYIQRKSDCMMSKDTLQEIYDNYKGIKIIYDITKLKSLKNLNIEYFKNNLITLCRSIWILPLPLMKNYYSTGI
jgi:hypothetical protein